MKPGIGKSIWAVLAGFLAAALLSVGMDQVLHASGIYPPEGQVMSNRLFALATTYRFIFQMAGGWLTAHLSPAKPMKHVWVLAGIGLVMSVLGILAWKAMGAAGGPLWYPIALAITAMPSVWLGGSLRVRRTHNNN
jgi:hypothetical protein